MTNPVRALLKQAPIVPVIVINNLDHAVPLANAMLEGGLPVLEITLRTPQGIKAVAKIKKEVPGAIVGTGTVVTADDIKATADAGGDFIVSPGATDNFYQAAIDSGVPFLPGVASVSDMMRGIEHGLDTFKFFPAEAAGGTKMLKSFAGPFADICFCPTGGIGPKNIAEYLALDTVLSVGGSWVSPDSLINAGDWQGLTALAREATDLVNKIRQTC